MVPICQSPKTLEGKLNLNIMSETKTYVFPENNASSLMSMLVPFMQKSGIDPNVLLAMNNGNNGWGNDNFIWLLFLLLFSNNGFGFGGNSRNLESLVNNDYGRATLLSAIDGNHNAINNLATQLNCSIDSVQTVLNNLTGAIANVGNQVGMTGQQVINALQLGNYDLGSKLASCCCDMKNLVTTQGYENQLAISGQTNAINATINGAVSTAQHASDSGFKAVLAKLDSMQNQTLLDKIDALREKNTALTNQISQEHQNAYFATVSANTIAPVNAAVTDLSTRLAKIECGLPATVSVPYSPVTAIPNCIAYNTGLYGYGYGPNGSFWG